MGQEFSSDIAGDGPRKRILDEHEYDPDQERITKRKTHNARRSKAARQADNLKQHKKRTKADRQADNLKQNKKRTKADRQADNLKQNKKRTEADRQADNLKQHKKRTKADRQAENSRRKLKSDISGMEYDTCSPFPPSAEQLNFTGQILGNAIAGLFAQQSPSPDISYAAVVADQLQSYIQPLMDFFMYQFDLECCDTLSGDLNYGKASANKALNNLDKLLVINSHYQLMFDFDVFDVYNPPSLVELKLLSTRHPFKPISALLKKKVENCKELIYSRIDTIVNTRLNNSERKEDANVETCGGTQNKRSSRYTYPPLEKYTRCENNIDFTVIGGTYREQPNASDFIICANELIAFQINNRARFAKVYKEGASKCFLMPADFKNRVMRNFYRAKFEQFRDGSANIKKNQVSMNNILGLNDINVPDEVDFAREYSERQQIELEYLRTNGVVTSEFESGVEIPFVQYDAKTNLDSQLMSDVISSDNRDGNGGNESSFNAEVERARKNFLDARGTCIKDWKVRDNTQDLLEKLGETVKKTVKGEHGECHCKKDSPSCQRLREQVDNSVKLLREANVDSENRLRMSQLLDGVLQKIEDISNRIIGVKLMTVIEQGTYKIVEDILNHYFQMGC